MYLVLVFLSGVLVGVFAYRLYMVNSVSPARCTAAAQQLRKNTAKGPSRR